MTPTVIEFMMQRRSVPIAQLCDPAPDDEQIRTIVQAAVRVPDHGRLTPWRLIVYRGQARHDVGERLAELALRRDETLPAQRLEQEKARFSRAPLVIAVVSSPREPDRIPEWEQFLSAGALAMSLVNAANALGYATNWVTNWYSNDEEGRRILGLAPHEKVAGIVHIGSYSGELPEKTRPEPESILSEYSGPWQG